MTGFPRQPRVKPVFGCLKCANVLALFSKWEEGLEKSGISPEPVKRPTEADKKSVRVAGMFSAGRRTGWFCVRITRWHTSGNWKEMRINWWHLWLGFAIYGSVLHTWIHLSFRQLAYFIQWACMHSWEDKEADEMAVQLGKEFLKEKASSCVRQ